MSEYGAGLLIFRPSDGKVLMTRRSPFGSSPGAWDFTGGHIEQGETELEAAIREGREELGGLPQLKVYTEPYWWSPNPFFAFSLFLAEVDASGNDWEPVLNVEHDLYGWFSPKQLPTPILEGSASAARFFFRA